MDIIWSSPFYRGGAATAAKSLQLCPTLCDPIDGSPPGSPIPGILQARTLEWVAISFSNAGKWKEKVKSLSRVWLCDPMDCSPPGSSVHGIFQARVLGGIYYHLQVWHFRTFKRLTKSPRIQSKSWSQDSNQVNLIQSLYALDYYSPLCATLQNKHDGDDDNKNHSNHKWK